MPFHRYDTKRTDNKSFHLQPLNQNYVTICANVDSGGGILGVTDDNQGNIWQLQSQMDANGLLEALQHDDPRIRKRAVVAIKAISAIQTIPALRVALRNEEDAELREIIVSTLDELMRKTGEAPAVTDIPAEPSEITELVAQLQSNDNDQITDAARQLGDLGDMSAVEPLVKTFNNPKLSIHVRLVAAEALLKLDGAPVEVALLAALRHSDWHIRRNGAAILGQLKAVWAIDPLTKALTDPHKVVRRTAYAALERIGTAEALSAIQKKPVTHHKRPVNPGAKLVVDPTAKTESTRKGLLKRLDGNNNQEEEEIEHQWAYNATKPLDPETVKLIEEQRRRTQEQEQANTDILENNESDHDTE